MPLKAGPAGERVPRSRRVQSSRWSSTSIPGLCRRATAGLGRDRLAEVIAAIAATKPRGKAIDIPFDQPDERSPAA
jgi:hypothetical protein